MSRAAVAARAHNMSEEEVRRNPLSRAAHAGGRNYKPGNGGLNMPEVIGDIRVKWLALGGPSSFLGQPLTDELGTPDGIGRFNHFQGGSIYWTPETGAHEIHGLIRDKWGSMGFERSLLGYPTSDELGTPDGIGRFNTFQGGSIYWTPGTDAHEIHGAIRDKWGSMGFERSLLGYPTSDELGTPDGIGRFNTFQGGSIYWTPGTDAHEIHGAIRDKWGSMGFERSLLGYPTSDELGTPDGIGRFNTFQGGSIYWTPKTGAHEVHGAILDKWASLGFERSLLGYPTSDEADAPGGRISHFEGGSITWTQSGGAVLSVPNPAITLSAVADQGRFIEVTGIRFTPNQTVKLGYDITSGGGPTTHQLGEDIFTSDGTGSFIHRIRVNLGGDISGAQAQATDVASGATATASI
jgi:uncharacterized protein with LGFP repeats